MLQPRQATFSVSLLSNIFQQPSFHRQMATTIGNCNALTARRFQAHALRWRFCQRAYSKIVVKESDIVLLKRKGDPSARPILTQPLRSSGKIQTPKGSIEQVSIVGRGIRDVVRTNKKVEYRIHQPTLAEYVTLSPRIVTPVYPSDANLIVSLLDLHPEARDESPIEIFEAGTGHGALTLHLARAIHGANHPAPPLPPAPENKPADAPAEGESVLLETDNVDGAIEQNAAVSAYETWKLSRRAVIHTLDISAQNSKHAQGTVRNFRHGIYYGNVDFHVGMISEYISARLAESPEPFIDHTILDLPSADSHLEVVGKALKPNGSVLVFCPSITQINKCVQLVRDRRLPLLLETVLELGAGVGVGGKEWDVRAVKPRALMKAEAEARVKSLEEETTETSPLGDLEITIEDSGWEMVCRPKVGERISGGGFLGLFRRMEQY